MNSSEIYKVVTDIASVGSTIAKSKILNGVVEDLDFQKICKLVYDPNSNFGIYKIYDDESDGSGNVDFDEHTWNLFEELQNRSLTGNSARQAVEEEINRLNKPSAELFKRVLRKNLQAGFSVKLLNKAKKGLIPTTPYMRCSLPKQKDFDKMSWEAGMFSQEKADGMFGNISYFDSDNIVITSRDGKVFPNEVFADFVSEISKVLKEGFQYHGEFLVMDGDNILPREQGNGIMNSLNNGLGKILPSQKIVYNVWDMVPLSDIKKGKCEIGYGGRLMVLESLLESNKSDIIKMIPTKVVHSLKEAREHYRELTSSGKEGTILKEPNAVWKDGTSKEVWKLKIEFECDLQVTDILMGKSGTKVDGRPASITVKSSDGNVVTNVTIKDEEMRDDIEASPDNWIGRIVAVKANNILKKSERYSLFLPRLVENSYRTDKDEADDLERVIAQYENTLLG